MLDRQTTPRTHYIHRLSYTTQERIVGAFVLIAIAILMWLMLSSGKTAHLFEDELTLYGELDHTQAVNKGTEVKVSGLSVGTVSAVDVTKDNRIVLTMKILKKYHNLLRTDSTARLSGAGLAVLGGSVIEISAGSPNRPLLVDGSTIAIKEAVSLDKLMEKIEPVFISLEQSVNRMNAILAKIDPQQVEDTLNRVNSASRNMDDISIAIKNGDGFANRAIYDQSFRKDIQATVNNMQQASVKINRLLDNLQQQLAQVPGLLNKVGPLLQEADKTIKATQRIWPLSSAVGEQQNKTTLTPAEPAND